MAYKCILRAVITVACISHIRGQYYDLFKSLQPFAPPQPSQPLNFFNDFTTRRTRPKQKVTNNVNKHDDNGRKLDKISITNIHEDNTRKTVSEHPDKNKPTTRRKLTTVAPIFDINFFTTTQRAIRKTTKIATTEINTDKQYKSQNPYATVPRVSAFISNSEPKNNKDSSAIIFFDDNSKRRPSNHRNSSKISDSRDSSDSNRPKPASSPNNRKTQNQHAITNESDNAWKDDGRNAVNYYTTRPPYYETTKMYNNLQNNNKNNNVNYYTTHNPLLNRPGVKPVVANGPPITNKPVTQRPDFAHKQQSSPNINDDFDATPEVISGPDEDYMSAVDKKRYYDILEKMCDKYKSLNTKQLQVIPLVPSPQPIKVNVSSCPPTTLPLVVGGKVVTIKEFPHMALLGWIKTKNRGYSWKCGGSLLSDQFILTAGHCAYQDRDDNVIAGPPRMVQLGSSYLNDPNAVIMKVAAVIRHPKYKQPKAYYDLSIVKMANTVAFSDMIKPACLGTPPQPNFPVIATGWGRTEFGGSQSNELRSVSIPVWDISECYDALGVSMKIPNGPSSDSQICAGEKKGGKDTCQGDSGGPAQIQDGCIWRVVAVTSVGRSCGAAETPAIYATVQRAFISAVVFGTEGAKNNNDNNNWNNNNDNHQFTNSNQESNNDRNNNKRNQHSDTANVNNKNNNLHRQDNTNEWNIKQSSFISNTGSITNSNADNNQGKINNWSDSGYSNHNQNNQRGYPDNNYNSQSKQASRNDYASTNYNNYKAQTTESYTNSNTRRESNDFYSPSPSSDRAAYNNYVANKHYRDNYSRPEYESDGGRETYSNRDGNVWWT